MKTFSAEGVINTRVAIPVPGRGIETALGKNPMRELLPDFPDMDDFMVQVFTIAIRGEEGNKQADVPDGSDATPEVPIGQEAPTEGPIYADPSYMQQAGTVASETGTADVPSPTPETPAPRDLLVNAPGIASLEQAIPEHETGTGAPGIPDPPTDARAVPDVQAD